MQAVINKYVYPIILTIGSGFMQNYMYLLLNFMNNYSVVTHAVYIHTYSNYPIHWWHSENHVGMYFKFLITTLQQHGVT